MYQMSARGVDEPMMNARHYYYYLYTIFYLHYKVLVIHTYKARRLTEMPPHCPSLQSLIRSKHRANVSVALTPELASPRRTAKLRPSSAPGTKYEADLALWSAGETDHVHKHEEFIRPDHIIPPEDPETERLRQELLATNVREITKEALLSSFAL